VQTVHQRTYLRKAGTSGSPRVGPSAVAESNARPQAIGAAAHGAVRHLETASSETLTNTSWDERTVLHECDNSLQATVPVGGDGIIETVHLRTAVHEQTSVECRAGCAAP
jgi:hypothetical protein